MKVRLSASLAMTALLLAGCSVQSPPETAPTSPVPSESAPAPTASSANPDDAASWTISYEGIGPVAWGQSSDEARASLGDFTEVPVEQCPELLVFESETLPNVWLVLDGDGVTIDQVVVTADSADAVSESPKTAEGIGVGSTVDEVVAAYPDAEVEEVPVADTRYSVTDGSGWINIVVRDAVVHEIVVRDEAAVSYEVCG